MATLNISLPEPMRKFIEQQVAKGGYATASEYLRDLIRQAEKKAGLEWLKGELRKGLNSGPATPMTKEDWVDIRRKAHERLEEKLRKGLESGPGAVAEDRFWGQRRAKLLTGHAKRSKSKRRTL